MGLLDGLETSIIDHGTDALLADRIVRAGDELQALKLQIKQLHAANEMLRADAAALRETIKAFERSDPATQAKHYVCGDCGSTAILRMDGPLAA